MIKRTKTIFPKSKVKKRWTMTEVRASQVAQWQRTHLPMQEMQETRVGSLGLEDPLESEMATHSSILAWRIPWTELQSIGLQRVRHD